MSSPRPPGSLGSLAKTHRLPTADPKDDWSARRATCWLLRCDPRSGTDGIELSARQGYNPWADFHAAAMHPWLKQMIQTSRRPLRSSNARCATARYRPRAPRRWVDAGFVWIARTAGSKMKRRARRPSRDRCRLTPHVPATNASNVRSVFEELAECVIQLRRSSSVGGAGCLTGFGCP
jgi:hypothetical protein